MSVSGEFHRVLADCLALLGASGVGNAEGWTAPLAAAAQRSREDLSAAARRVLEVLVQSRAGPSFPSELEKEQFDQLREHLEAICQAIVGSRREA